MTNYWSYCFQQINTESPWPRNHKRLNKVCVLSTGFSLKLNTIKGFNKTKTLLKTLNVFVLIFWNTCVISLQPTVFYFFFFALSLDTTVVAVWYYCILLTLVCLFLKIHITDRSWPSKNDSLIFKNVL